MTRSYSDDLRARVTVSVLGGRSCAVTAAAIWRQYRQ
jgi:hypothetical protein